MKTKVTIAVGMLFVAVWMTMGVAQDKGDAKDASVLKDDKSKASYAIGVRIAKNFKQQQLELDEATLIQGIRDGFSGAKTALTDQEMNAAIMKLQEEITAKHAEGGKMVAEKSKKDGEAFLAANKDKEGVVTLKSGLQYKVLVEGKGESPKATSVVKTHYRGTLIDGTEFDSSYKRNAPASFPVNRVIAGWTEALQLMKVGSKWQLFIPSDLAYGANSPPGSAIPPNSVLVFEVELISIEK